jgi:LPS O-antigen subunit length determinant protein (WzzB/FepE family)
MSKKTTDLIHEIDLGNLIRLLWREKILIVTISIICSLIGYIFTPSKLQEFKIEITLKDPPIQIFESYTPEPTITLFKNNTNNNIKNYNDGITQQFIFDFKLNFLSINNLEIFLEQNREFYNFKEFLNSRNINVNKYLADRFGSVKEKNVVISNKYFLVFPKELDGVAFLSSYADFIKKKTIAETKNNLKLTIQNKITSNEQALEIANIIELEEPILKSAKNNLVAPEVEDLFYKGSKVLSQNIVNLKKLVIRLENDQFNYDHKLDRSVISEFNSNHLTFDYLTGLIFGFLLSFVIIFFKSLLRNK